MCLCYDSDNSVPKCNQVKTHAYRRRMWRDVSKRKVFPYSLRRINICHMTLNDSRMDHDNS